MHCENSSYKQTPVIDIKTSAKLLNWFLLEFELFHKCKQHFCMLDFIKRCKCANACAGVQLQMWLRGREREHWSAQPLINGNHIHAMRIRIERKMLTFTFSVDVTLYSIAIVIFFSVDFFSCLEIEIDGISSIQLWKVMYLFCSHTK